MWKPLRKGYVRDRNSNATDGFRLQGNPPKAFCENQGPVEDLEAGTGGARKVEESAHALTEVSSGWDITKRSLTDESSDETRRYTGSGGAKAVHAEM
jgi:hypothetical protein